MASRWMLLTVVTSLWLSSISDVIAATKKSPLTNDRNATAASTNSSTQQAGVTSYAATADFNCLTHWLRISGASVDDVTSLVASGQLTLARLDENTIQIQPAFLLTIILQHKHNLTNNLKACIARHSVCPSGRKVTDYPCDESGRCIFNVTTKTTSCQCPQGRKGVRCQQDIDECSKTKLNNCASDQTATCTNFHGSYFCTCNEGYFGDGVECSDEDECSKNIHDCHGNANCTNAIGSYQCSCKTGFYGDGRHCQEDICQGSKDVALCAKVREIGDFNQRLQSKLEQRDKTIQRMHSDMLLLASLFTRYEKNTRETAEKTSSTYRRLDDLSVRVTRNQAVTKQRVNALDAKIAHTISEEMQRTHQHVTNISDTLEGVKAAEKRKIDQLSATTAELKAGLVSAATDRAMIREEESRKCGIVSLKSYTQTTGTGGTLSWNVVFNKTRSDTDIRILYTSSFGGYAQGGWHCHTRSILINGSECADPAPIRGGISLHATAGNVHVIVPGAISGVCKVPTAGPLTLTMTTASHCKYGSYDDLYNGASSQRITATLNVEELC